MRITRQPAAAALALVMLLGAASGCSRPGRRARPAAPPVPFAVRNNGFFDVNVYVLRSSSGSATRIGTVTGNSSARLALRRTDLQANGTLVVRVHAIGTLYTWESPPVTVSSDVVARLDVYTDSDGGMTRSSLYTLPDDR